MAPTPTTRNEPSFELPASNMHSNPFAPPKAQVGVPAKKRSGKLLPYEKAGRVIRLMSLLGGVGVIGIGAAILLPTLSSGKSGLLLQQIIMLSLLMALVVGLFFVGSAVMRHETWARNLGIVYGLISLIGFPIGTLVGIYVLWQLVFGWSAGDTDA